MYAFLYQVDGDTFNLLRGGGVEEILSLPQQEKAECTSYTHGEMNCLQGTFCSFPKWCIYSLCTQILAVLDCALLALSQQYSIDTCTVHGYLVS